MHRSDAFRGGTPARWARTKVQFNPIQFSVFPIFSRRGRGRHRELLREGSRMQKKRLRKRQSHEGAHSRLPFGARHPERGSYFLVTGAAADHPRPSYDNRLATPPAPLATGCRPQLIAHAQSDPLVKVRMAIDQHGVVLVRARNTGVVIRKKPFRMACSRYIKKIQANIYSPAIALVNPSFVTAIHALLGDIAPLVGG